MRQRKLVTSAQNEGVKRALKLRDRRARTKAGLFLIEGYREVLRAVQRGIEVVELYACKELFLGSNEEKVIAEAEGRRTQVIEVTRSIFEKLAYRDRPEGLLTVARIPQRSLGEIELGGTAPLFLVAETIEKPGNLGTMIRCADAAGARGVIVADPRTDVWNPNVVRASIGCLFTVPVVQAAGTEVMQWLRQKGIRTVAASPEATSEMWDCDMTGPTAIVVGSEAFGLSRSWLEGADQAVRIPMGGDVDSLNAAIAASLMLFEAVRQRRPAR